MKKILVKLLCCIATAHSLDITLIAAETDGIAAFLQSQGIKSFDEHVRQKREGLILMVWMRGSEKGTVVIECDLIHKTLEKSVLTKSGVTKEKKVLASSDASVLKFLCTRTEFGQIPSADPYDAGMDGDSIHLEVHLSESHWRFERWAPFQAWKLPVVASTVPDPFAQGAGRHPSFQSKPVSEESLVTLVASLLQACSLGEMLPTKHESPRTSLPDAKKRNP